MAKRIDCGMIEELGKHYITRDMTHYREGRRKRLTNRNRHVICNVICNERIILLVMRFALAIIQTM